MTEINFLCVHKKLRSKRVAPSLISEVTRRINREGIFQAAYTAGAHLPRPITACQCVGGTGGGGGGAPQLTTNSVPFPLRYYHRPLDPKKLIEIGFSALKRNERMKDVIRRNALRDVCRGGGVEHENH